MRRSSNTGFSYIELLVVMGVIVLLAGLTFRSYRTITASKSLSGDAMRVVAELIKARSLTLASKNADQYGVHFGATSVTLFEGASYSVGNAGNVVSTLSPLLTISSITLSGGASDVIFDRLTGTTAQNGTITLSSTDNSTSKTITIYETGLSEIN